MNHKLVEWQDELWSAETAWAAAGFCAAILADAAGRKILQSGYRRAAGKEPPNNPAAPGTSWREAILWGVVTGAIIGVVRAASRHGASSAQRRWGQRVG